MDVRDVVFDVLHVAVVSRGQILPGVGPLYARVVRAYHRERKAHEQIQAVFVLAVMHRHHVGQAHVAVLIADRRDRFIRQSRDGQILVLVNRRPEAFPGQRDGVPALDRHDDLQRSAFFVVLLEPVRGGHQESHLVDRDEYSGAMLKRFPVFEMNKRCRGPLDRIF